MSAAGQAPRRADGLARAGEDGAARGDAGSPARMAASGPRAAGAATEYERLIGAIHEGYELHYGPARSRETAEADLALLEGDELYARGLAQLVALGDLPAVAELADVITLTALAHGAGDGELAAAIWQAGARAVGWGRSAEHEQAKALAREGSPRALAAMRAAARGAGEAG